jgi:hypothetical protein
MLIEDLSIVARVVILQVHHGCVVHIIKISGCDYYTLSRERVARGFETQGFLSLFCITIIRLGPLVHK